jgi:hypothetical protein
MSKENSGNSEKAGLDLKNTLKIEVYYIKKITTFLIKI